MVYLSHQHCRRMLVPYCINASENRDVFFFNLQISKMMRICYCVFDNEIPQEEKYIFVRRYLYDCTRLSQSNSW